MTISTMRRTLEVFITLVACFSSSLYAFTPGCNLVTTRLPPPRRHRHIRHSSWTSASKQIRQQPPPTSLKQVTDPSTVWKKSSRQIRRRLFAWGKSDSSVMTTTTSQLSATASRTGEGKSALDNFLAKLTASFPFFVLGTAILGLKRPSSLLWTNRGSTISWMLASVMCATGLTLEKKDFTDVLQDNFSAVPAGVLCQFCIMPLMAMIIGRTMLLNSLPHGPSLFLGLCLVGCSPGGTASNLVALIAKANVALSVLLTSASTILASVVTPILVKLLVGSTVAVSGWTLCEATAKVVLLPVILGMFVNSKTPSLASKVSRFTPFASVVLVSLICGGVVAQNAALFLQQSSTLVPLILASVLALHCTGFLAGYLIPRFGLKLSENTSRTISIETGMQNSALAVVLARSIGASPVASLPGALSAVTHSCLGSILAGYWHRVRQKETTSAKTSMSIATSSPQEVVKDTSTGSATAPMLGTGETLRDADEKPDEGATSSLTEGRNNKQEPSQVTTTTAVVKDECMIEDQSETAQLMQKVKDAGVAGIISYALWELGFWFVSVPVCIVAYNQLTGHWPNFSNQDDMSKLGAEAFAFVNFARFAVPLRIGLALGTTPWIQENIVDTYFPKDDEEDCEIIDEA